MGAVVLACSGESTSPGAGTPPVFLRTSAISNPGNVLSAILTVAVRGADSVAARFRVNGQTGDSATPPAVAHGDSATVPLLGLLPATLYSVRAIAFGGGDSALSEPIEFRTGDPPGDLPSYTASGPDPTPGFVVFAAGVYGLVIDNTGRVVWYHRFPNGAGLNFMAQPNGKYVGHPPTPDTTDVEPWVELDPLGTVTRTLGCSGGLPSRFHDMISESDGGYWIMCDETRVMDLSAVGGSAAARVTGTVVQHVRPNGTLAFQWSPFDHFAVTDLDAASRSGPTVNWTHGNAIDLTPEGDLLISFRSLSEITKIRTATGAIVWRMGGLASQFTFLDTPLPPFTRQHSLRLTKDGLLLLLDNLGTPGESRAERFQVDELAHTARLVSSYASTPPVVTSLGGTVQELPGGRTLVSFGTAGRVEEFDQAGRRVWQIEGNAGYVFRAQRIGSLYRPGEDTPR
ncbi:MAG TPA: arylsulfotransferase family protein [Gemmatimonadales bacterium]|nr:arylsulfotransferase family protein [Gemmatimonadales bacterium]